MSKTGKSLLGPLVALLIGLLVTFIYVFPGLFIYPPLHRFQKSPAAYISQQKNILTGASISLIVEEHGSRLLPKVALTFDADMTPGMKMLLTTGVVKSWYNREIQRTLDREHVPATIFLGGLWTQTYPDEAKALAVDSLIEIGNHSYNHYAFTSTCFGLPFIDDTKDVNDVAMAQKIIQQKTGVTPKYFRFPGGCYDRVDLETVAKLGLTIVHWDVVARDGFNTDTDSIVRAVESQVQNGSIIVMHIHDGSYAPKTNDALLRIIPDLKKRGFQFVKVSEVLANQE
jgi:peptidoglycan/xylan/chitin deacetylase (PgdA/CDA1 family)